MKFTISFIDNQLLLKSDYVTILEISNPKLFSRIISLFYKRVTLGDERNDLLLSDDDNNIKNISKETILLTNYYDFTFIHKKLISKFNEKILSNLNYNYASKDQINILLNKISNLVTDSIEVDLDYEFSVPEADKIIKIMDFNFTNIFQNESIYDIIKNIIELISDMNICKIIVLVNLKSYISSIELLNLYKYSKYRNIFLLLIESKESILLEYEYKIYIDDDFDELIYQYE